MFISDEDKMLSDFQRIGSIDCESSCDISYNAVNNGTKMASLCNLGNTCFLNSVLYTLRFTPTFLHNLHHLATDLSTLTEKRQQNRVKFQQMYNFIAIVLLIISFRTKYLHSAELEFQHRQLQTEVGVVRT